MGKLSVNNKKQNPYVHQHKYNPKAHESKDRKTASIKQLMVKRLESYVRKTRERMQHNCSLRYGTVLHTEPIVDVSLLNTQISLILRILIEITYTFYNSENDNIGNLLLIL